jgi:hypothetical protein
MNSKYLLSCALGLAFATHAMAAKPVSDQNAVDAGLGSNEVMVTQSSAKGGKPGSAFGLDFVSDGNAVAFEFTVAFPKGTNLRSVNLDKCVSQLPSSHTGKCLANENTGEVLVMVYSLSNAKLPAGIVSVGEIAMGAQSKSAPQVIKALAVDDKIREYSIPANLN